MASDEEETTTGDSFDPPLVIFMQGGKVIEAQMNGEEVRAMVCNYDVKFPCPAGSVKTDADGKPYFATII